MAKHLAPCARLGSDDRQFISIRATHTLYTALATGSRDGHAFTEVGLHVRSDRGCGVEQDFKIRSAYRSTLLVVGPGNASLLHVAALVAAVKRFAWGFAFGFFGGVADERSRTTAFINVCSDCTPCQYMSKDSRSPAWPNVPVSKCECVPAPLILILRALPFLAGIRQVLIFTRP